MANRLKTTLILLISGLILCAAPKLTRGYAYRYFTSRDDLPQMQIVSIFQDKDGYLWLGAKGSVMRYDGKTFKTFGSEDEKFMGEVYSISEIGHTKLFFLRYLFTYLDKNEKMHLVEYPDSMISNGGVINAIGLNDNEFIILNLSKPNDRKENYNQQHFIYNFRTKRFKRIKGFHKNILDINGNHIVADDGIYSYSGLNIKRIYHTTDTLNYACINSKQNNCFVHNRTKNRFEKYEIRNNKMVCTKIVQKPKDEKDTRFVVLSDERIVTFNKYKQPTIYPSEKTNFSISVTYPDKLFVDRENNLWITSNNGLYNFFSLNLTEYKFGLSEPDNIWSIMDDPKGQLWIGSFGKGLWRLKKNDKLIPQNQENPGWKEQYFKASKDKSGTLYFPNSHGISIYKNGQFLPQENTGTCLYSFFDKDTHQIYYSGQDSLNNRNINIGYGKTRKTYSWDKGFIISIAKDAHNIIRVGSFRAQGRLVGNRLIADPPKKEYMGIISMQKDAKGRLWKGTTKGIYVELPNGKEFRVAPQITSLIIALVIWNEKYIICNTASGFAIFSINDNLQKPNLYTFDYKNGFTAMEMSQNGIHIMNNNDVLVCGSFSLMRFNPERLIKSYKIATPNVRITAIQTSTDNFVWINKQSNSGNINIYKKERFLKIEYVANSISLPDMLLFRYRLKGFSGKWSQPTNQRTALYTNLSAGNYTFEVQCSIDGVHWSRAAGSPPLHFIRPLWQRWWAIAIYAIIAILTVMLITRYYLRQKEKKRIELLQRAKLENELHLKNLRSRVIPHFTKNVLSAIGHFAMTEKLKASHYISVFSKFSENTLHFADKNYIKLSDEINYTMQYLELEKIRFEKKNFEFKLQISENTNQDILIPALTLHTYCDNAIRHGLINKTQSDWEIILDFEKTDLGTIIRVTDNGIGRQKAQALGTRGNGQGLLLIQQQILFYNSANRSKISQEIIDLTNEEGECAGTQIMLFIPDNYSFN